MKRMTLKMAALVLSTLMLSSVSSADPMVEPAVFVKNGDRSVRLTISYNGTAKIATDIDTYIEGALKSDGSGSYEVEREEGDVCPTSARIEMYHDTVYGENASAEVRVKFPEDSPTAERLCGSMRRIEGTYTRIQVKPLTIRCAPPAGAPVAKCL